jgi:hypothetical protein
MQTLELFSASKMRLFVPRTLQEKTESKRIGGGFKPTAGASKVM